VGQGDRALELLARIVERGYYGITRLERSPWSASIRDRPEFASILATAAARSEEVRQAFVDAGGEELLGLAHRRAS
jgi:hypothetical protein